MTKKDPRLARAGVSGFNKPKRTPNHKTKSHVVVAKKGDKTKTIRFGQQGVRGAGKNPQSAKDKAEGELREKSSKYEKLEVIDSWLQKNPHIVEKLQDEANKQEAGGPPQKPEDYEILEEASDGSSSQVWRQEYDQWLIDQGAQKAMKQAGKN